MEMNTNTNLMKKDSVNITEKTLAAQMQITDREIEGRKKLLNLGENDVQAILQMKDLILEGVDNIVDAFYTRQTEHPEISLLIGDSESLQRLRAAMRRYIIELFEGYYDANYVNKRLRIGKVHKRIGVSPKLYVSAVHQLSTSLTDYVRQHAPARTQVADIQAFERALTKIVMFDLQLVFDTYISSMVAEVEAAKGEVEEYARSLEAVVEERTRELRELSEKDGLTGLGNQRNFYEQLRFAMSLCERQEQPLTLAYLDLNGFKSLNDTEGHKTGDMILALVGRVISRTIRNHDIACRYGGDEFCIIMINTNVEQAKIMCTRLIAAFGQEENKGISFSIGLAENSGDSHFSRDDLVKLADANMYKAKEKARKKPGHYVHPPLPVSRKAQDSPAKKGRARTV